MIGCPISTVHQPFLNSPFEKIVLVVEGSNPQNSQDAEVDASSQGCVVTQAHCQRLYFIIPCLVVIYIGAELKFLTGSLDQTPYV